MADLAKLLEEIKSMSIIELAEFVKTLEAEFGVSAAAPVAAGGTTTNPDTTPAEEKTEFDVVLKEIGANKIAVIKVVRELTGLGLAESKAVVEGAPKTVKEALPKDQAEAAVAKFKEAGAVAEIK